ncbi:MAG TPA: lamin tail domain-containing protein, partial [Chitinophagales bacterium]|nr:lamin tail domain-containing protein [Chitinophagales bacterium]
MTSRLLLFSLLVTIHAAAFSQLVINEGSNRNYSQYLSASGEYEDWIEIYNAGTSAVELSDYYLSDNAGQPFKWNFPTGIIQPGAFLLVE